MQEMEASNAHINAKGPEDPPGRYSNESDEEGRSLLSKDRSNIPTPDADDPDEQSRHRVEPLFYTLASRFGFRDREHELPLYELQTLSRDFPGGVLPGRKPKKTIRGSCIRLMVAILTVMYVSP
jgi:hypothetical protein